MEGPCLGGCRVFLFLLYYVVCIIVSQQAYCVQYYDPKSRRYVTIEDENQDIRGIRSQIRNNGSQMRAIPNAREIDAENRRRIQQEQEKVEQQRNAGTQAYRKFDPNRYHKTEEISFF